MMWSPASCSSIVSQSTNASESSKIGEPVRPGPYETCANRSAPFCANRRQISSASSSRKLVAHLPDVRRRGQVDDDFAAQNNTIGGSSETDVNELHAMPTGRSR